MDTFEARTHMLDVAEETLDIVRRVAAGETPSLEDRQRLRKLLLEARQTLPDAGYPGEATWRSVQRASMGIDTMGDQTDADFWDDVAGELQNGMDTLSSLISPNWRRETDFHIIG